MRETENKPTFTLFSLKIFWCGPSLKSLLNLLQYCLSFVLWPQGTWDLSAPEQGSNPCPPALEGEVPTTGWPGKSPLLRESDFCSRDLWWLIPFPWRESWKIRPHYLSTWLPGTSCLLKINGVSPAWELRGLLASFLLNQPPALTRHQSQGRQCRLRAGEGGLGRANGPLHIFPAGLLISSKDQREKEATHSASWFFFNTTQHPTIPRGCFPFKVVTLGGLMLIPRRLPYCRMVGITSGLTASPESFLQHFSHLGGRSSSNWWVPSLETATGSGQPIHLHLPPHVWSKLLFLLSHLWALKAWGLV